MEVEIFWVGMYLLICAFNIMTFEVISLTLLDNLKTFILDNLYILLFIFFIYISCSILLIIFYNILSVRDFNFISSATPRNKI